MIYLNNAIFSHESQNISVCGRVYHTDKSLQGLISENSDNSSCAQYVRTNSVRGQSDKHFDLRQLLPHLL